MSEEESKCGPCKQLVFDRIDQEGWEFYSTKSLMLNTKEMEDMEEVSSTQGLPSMLFGFNRLLLVNRKHDFLYEFNP